MAFPPKLVPAGFVLPAEACNVFLRCHQWEMRCVMSQVMKKWLLLGDGLINILQRIGRPQVRAVPFPAHFTGIRGNLFSVVEQLKARVVDAWAGLTGKIKFAERRAKRAGEPTLPGRCPVLQTEMPLAGHTCCIARIAEYFA